MSRGHTPNPHSITVTSSPGSSSAWCLGRAGRFVSVIQFLTWIDATARGPVAAVRLRRAMNVMPQTDETGSARR